MRFGTDLADELDVMGSHALVDGVEVVHSEEEATKKLIAQS